MNIVKESGLLAVEFTVTSGLSPLASCVLGSDPWDEVVLLAGFQRVLLARSKQRPGFRGALVSLSVIFFHVYQSGSHFSNSKQGPCVPGLPHAA